MLFLGILLLICLAVERKSSNHISANPKIVMRQETTITYYLFGYISNQYVGVSYNWLGNYFVSCYTIIRNFYIIIIS